jgi:hypothetical protein
MFWLSVDCFHMACSPSMEMSERLIVEGSKPVGRVARVRRTAAYSQR